MSTDINFAQLCACKGTMHHMAGYHNAAMTQGSWTYAIGVNGVASALRVTLDTTVSKGRDFEHRVRVNPGDQLNLVDLPTGTPTMRTFRYGVIFESDKPREQPLMGGYNQNIAVTSRFNLVQGYYSWDTTESNRYQYIPTTGVIKNLYAKSITNPPGAGKTHTVTLYKNGVATSLAAVFGAAATTANDVDPTHQVSVVAGDYVSINSVGTAGGNAMALLYGCIFQPEIDGEAIVMQRDTDTLNTTTTEYLPCVGYNAVDWSTSTAAHGGVIAGFTVKKHYLYLSGAAGATGADGYTISIYDALRNVAYIPLQVLGASTSASDTTTFGYVTPYTTASQDYTVLAYRCIPTGTPNAVSTWDSFVRYLPPDKHNDYDLRNQLGGVGKNGGRIPCAKAGRRMGKRIH